MRTEILTGTTLVLGDGGLHYPMTITLKSSDSTRKIELSSDGGTEYFQPAVDVTSTTMLVLTVASPISRIKVTGVANDTVIIEDN